MCVGVWGHREGLGKGRHDLGLRSGSATFPLSGPCAYGNLSDSYTHTHTHTHTRTRQTQKNKLVRKRTKKNTHEIRFLNKIVTGNRLYSRREEFFLELAFASMLQSCYSSKLEPSAPPAAPPPWAPLPLSPLPSWQPVTSSGCGLIHLHRAWLVLGAQ